ncbi:helix-turn-helix domain-containing protein [Brevibacillus borstelensis]|uniref:helix-turn-helix domain-containing protein n=1 Tax=Brevibacillus borstelensis TaxID=45462 RepID=UPI002E1AF7CE|nr:helix-turn-helix domain-containing protein [Brevibacillus borstelensis]
MIGYVIRGEEEASKWYHGYMNSKQAAEYLGISRYMLRKLVKEDKIPYSQSFRDVSFHQTILDAWMRGEFIPGRVELILDEEKIEYEHQDALKEHYQRYPELLEKVKERAELHIPNVSSEYNFDVRQDGVSITLGSQQNIAVQLFLSNEAIEQLIQTVQLYRSGQDKNTTK